MVERAVRGRQRCISILWMSATGPIADMCAIDSLRLAPVRPAGLVPSPRRVYLQSITTYSEHRALTSGRTESSLVIYLVDTFGGGPVAAAHIVYIHLSDELGDLSIRHLSGRSDGERV